MTDILIDSSILTKTNCEMAYYYRAIASLTEPSSSEAQLGSCLHRFIEKHQRGIMTAAPEAMAEYGSHQAEAAMLQYAMASFMAFTDDPPLTLTDGKPAVEVKFKVEHKRIVRGDKEYVIYLCGTIDLISLVNGFLNIKDYKTTRGGWDRTAWFAKHDLSSQMLFYTYCVRKYGHVFLPLSYANLAAMGNIYANIIAVFLTAKPTPKFVKSPPMSFSNEQMDAFSEALEYTINTIVTIHDTGVAYRTGMINGFCGYNGPAVCKYLPLCKFGDNMMDQFITKPYDPMNHR